MINHCDRHITHLGDLDISFVLLDISSKFLLPLECYLNYHPKSISKQVNRLNRPKDMSVSLRRVISLSQRFITLCFWLYCKFLLPWYTLNIFTYNNRSLPLNHFYILFFLPVQCDCCFLQSFLCFSWFSSVSLPDIFSSCPWLPSPSCPHSEALVRLPDEVVFPVKLSKNIKSSYNEIFVYPHQWSMK